MLVIQVFKATVCQNTSVGHAALRPPVRNFCFMGFDSSPCVPSTGFLQTRVHFFNLVATFMTLNWVP